MTFVPSRGFVGVKFAMDEGGRRVVKSTMDEGNRRIVSNERIDLIKAYERETTFRGRAIVADKLWTNLPAHTRTKLTKGGHPGYWLQDQLAASDERTGRPALTPNSRNALRVLLQQEQPSARGRPARNVAPVWQWLDDGEIAPSQVRFIFDRVRELMALPDADWDTSLNRAKDFAKTARFPGKAFMYTPEATAPQAPVDDEDWPPKVEKGKNGKQKKPEPKAEPKARGAVEKTLQYQAFRRVLDEAPDARALPIPEGVEAQTYREAYTEMLENVRLALDIAGREFTNAKRRYRASAVAIKGGVLAKACRTLRVAVPAAGEPVDEFNSRRKWLDIVRAYHPDMNPGDGTEATKVKSQIYDSANKAFEVIKAYNRTLTNQKSEEKTSDDDDHDTSRDQQATAQP